MMFNLKRTRKEYGNPGAFLCHLAKADLLKQLPAKFSKYADLLARARTKSFQKNDLAFACKIIAKLASYEAMNLGYFCQIKRSIQLNEISGSKSIYQMVSYEITCEKEELDKIKTNIENIFFDKYKIRIKFEAEINSQKSESFYTSKPNQLDNSLNFIISNLSRRIRLLS